MGETSRKQTARAQALRRMKQIAGCRVNDAVKLAFLDSGLEQEQIAVIDGLAALVRLAALGQEGEREQAEAFFQALERKAGEGHEA